MPHAGSCPRCFRALPADANGGLCPTCRRADTLRGVVGPFSTAEAASTPSPRAADTPSTPRESPLADPPTTEHARPQPDPAATRSCDPGPGADGFSLDPRDKLPYPPPGYDLIARLGIGGVGTVYLAREHATERLVAIKYLNSPSNPNAFDRFLIEVRALAALDHPNIVRVISTDFYRADPYFTMEYADGGSLAARVGPDRPLPPAEALRLVLAVAEGVITAHAAGILHRDIKPSNVLLSGARSQESGVRSQESESTGPGSELTPDSCLLTPKLSDFGLAKLVDQDLGLTQTGPLGTPCFMSPEAAAGRHRDIGEATDVYGLGATLYFLLTGRPPFESEGREQTVQKVLRDDPPRPRSLRPDLPAELEAVVLRAMDKDPSHRHPTAAALAADLRLVQQGKAPPPLPWRVRARRWLVRHRRRIGAAVAVLAVVALFAAALWPTPARDPNQAIRDEIQKGKKARLLAADGRPRAPSWPLGPAEIETSTDAGGTCSFKDAGTVVLLLLDDPGVESYRVEADICQKQKLANVVLGEDPNTAEVGLVLGYADQDAGNGNSVHSLILLRFTDYEADDGPKMVRELKVTDLAIRAGPGLAVRNVATHDGVPPAPLHRLPTEPRFFRKVIFEVTPSGVRVPGPDGLQSTDPVDIAARREMVRTNSGPVPADPLPAWKPRMPVGIWSRASWVSVRNVTIEAIR